MTHKRRLLCLLLLLFAAGTSSAAAPYSLHIARTGDAALDGVIKDASLLSSLHEAPPETLLALVDRARSDAGRLKTALESFGYYQAVVTITVAGQDIRDLNAFVAMEGQPEQTVPVEVAIETGPLYRLRKIGIEGGIPAAAANALDLKAGEPAVAAKVLAGRDRLLSVLRQEGYAFATVAAPVAYADDAAHVLDVSFAAGAGSKANIGTISFRGVKTVHEDFLRRVLELRSGSPYIPDKIDQGRRNLLALDVFSAVSVRNPETPEADGSAPLTIDVTERKPHSVAFSANYSTDLGSSVSASWLHRNLFGNAEQLSLSASATGLGGSAADGLGYDLSLRFKKPCIWGCERQLELALSGVKQKLDAYDRTAESLGATLRGTLTPQWSVNAGVSLTYDETAQSGSDRHYQLFAFPFGAAYDGTGAGLAITDPLHGYRAGLTLTPVVSVDSKDLLFAQLQASGSAYFDLFGNGRSVLALRGLVGSMQGASSLDLPPDQRFYAGGSATVRGFRYQSIGPAFADGKPAGASSVDAVSLEWRQRVYREFGVAGFIDAGQAGKGSLPFDGSMQIGAGAGLRYYTPIGAIRFDIAVPLTSVPRNDSFQIYLSLGQAF